MSLSKFRGKRAAAYDDLARAIHGAIVTLEATGAIGPADADPDYAPFNGYCARACAAYVYLSSHEPRAVPLCENPGMRLKKLKEPGSKFGESHYWLEGDDGRVLDLVFTDRNACPQISSTQKARADRCDVTDTTRICPQGRTHSASSRWSVPHSMVTSLLARSDTPTASRLAAACRRRRSAYSDR